MQRKAFTGIGIFDDYDVRDFLLTRSQGPIPVSTLDLRSYLLSRFTLFTQEISAGAAT